MIPHTKAFKRLKDEAQAVFNFAIVVCYAVPSLKAMLKAVSPSAELPFAPDHFDSRPISTDKVRAHTKEYKKVLSRYIFLSSFSFFEAYVLDLLKEIIEFHGQDELLRKHELIRNAALSSPDMEKARNKLREYRVPKNMGAYSSYGKRLAAEGFVFPSAVLARRGLEQLIEMATGDYIKAVEIPNLIESVLQLPLDPKDERERFHGYRGMRNDIAHGRANAASFHLGMAIEANNFLRNLALKVDKHVVENLLLVEL